MRIVGIVLAAAIVVGHGCGVGVEPSGPVPELRPAEPVEAGSLEGGTGGAAGAAGSPATGGAAGMAGAAGSTETHPVPGPPPSALPFDYARPDVGTPVGPDELRAVTERYLELLRDTRYFDLLDERVHGWPETDPEGKYWYGSWWSGVTVVKQGGKVSYQHGANGADNNGVRTSPLMEGTCYAYLMWNEPQLERLLHRMVRGFVSWRLAFKQAPDDPTRPLLARAAYPRSVVWTQDGRSVFIDYSLNRPGIDTGASAYVQIPANPYWGDIFVKNKRSKDDIGHMYRAMAQVESCGPRLSPDAAATLADMRYLFAEWSRQVEDDFWRIATLDKNHSLVFPSETFAVFTNLMGAECAGMLAIRLQGRGDPGWFDCGSGMSQAEDVGGPFLDSNNMQMMRSYHEAAANYALLTGHGGVAQRLVEGLATRLDQGMNAIEAGAQPPNLRSVDFAALIMHAANVGVPLTSREVRWLHTQLDEAHASYRAAAESGVFRVFDSSTPDGTYPFEPGGTGMQFPEIGLALGTCASQYRNPTSQPVLDCERVMQRW